MALCGSTKTEDNYEVVGTISYSWYLLSLDNLKREVSESKIVNYAHIPDIICSIEL